MIKLEILITFIFLIGFVSAICNETQIDINTASLIELDKIINVGPATAEKIIANRTYNSINDLIRVKGIGNITLAEIKAQNLACVREEIQNGEVNVPANKTNTTIETNKNKTQISLNTSEKAITTKTVNNYSNESNGEAEAIELAPIFLNSNSILSNSEDIKTENNKEILKKNLPFYGIIAFCIIFGTSFLLRRRKNKHGFE